MDATALYAAIRRQTNLTTSDISDADLLTILNEGLREIATQTRWEWLAESTTLTTVASTVEIALPADFMFMRLVQKAGTSDEPLQQMSFDEYKYWYGDNAAVSDSATHYYIRFDSGSGFIGIYPTPSTNGTDRFDIFYYETPTELSAGGDSPGFDARFHSILVDYAAYRLWEREEYFDESERAFQRYGRRLREMMQFYSTRDNQHRLIVGDGTQRRLGSLRRRLGWS